MQNKSQANVWVIIPAAGSGKRMQTEIPKQYLQINNKAILQYTLECFADLSFIKGFVVAISPEDKHFTKLDLDTQKPLFSCQGGSERFHSVFNALQYLDGKAEPKDWVMVHDAARPCVQAGDIEQLYRQCSEQNCGGILAYPVKDTLKKQQSAKEVIDSTIDRSGLWHALTPQMFPLLELKQAIKQSMENQLAMTDDASAMEAAGHRVLLVYGNEDNIKITRPADLSLASWIIQNYQRDQQQRGN